MPNKYKPLPVKKISKPSPAKLKCERCGASGHTEPNCPLKAEADRELAKEAKRRLDNLTPLQRAGVDAVLAGDVFNFYFVSGVKPNDRRYENAVSKLAETSARLELELQTSGVPPHLMRSGIGKKHLEEKIKNAKPSK
jgi:hypothetical protein